MGRGGGSWRAGKGGVLPRSLLALWVKEAGQLSLGMLGGGGGDDLSPLSEWKGPPGTIQWGNKAWDCSWPQLRLLS